LGGDPGPFKLSFLTKCSLSICNLLLGSAAVEPNHSSSAVIYTHAFSESNSTNQGDNISYWEWEWHTPSHIDNTKVPSGYE
jgi:hypothetical protein